MGFTKYTTDYAHVRVVNTLDWSDHDWDGVLDIDDVYDDLDLIYLLFVALLINSP